MKWAESATVSPADRLDGRAQSVSLACLGGGATGAVGIDYCEASHALAFEPKVGAKLARWSMSVANVFGSCR